MLQMNSLKHCKRIGLVEFAQVRLYRCDCRFRIALNASLIDYCQVTPERARNLVQIGSP